MANTVIAIFDDINSAKQAEMYLLEQGFTQSEVALKTAVYKQHSEDHSQAEKQGDMVESIKAFFNDLFGNDELEASTYHTASQNRTIISVHTNTDHDAENVVGILDRYGAINVNETAGSYFPGEQQDNFRTSAIKSRIVQRAVAKL